MIDINPQDLPIPKLHQILLGAIGPRPIAFASTVDAEGNPNLSPFSFFNVFSANPPILIFPKDNFKLLRVLQLRPYDTQDEVLHQIEPHFLTSLKILS